MASRRQAVKVATIITAAGRGPQEVVTALGASTALYWQRRLRCNYLQQQRLLGGSSESAR